MGDMDGGIQLDDLQLNQIVSESGRRVGWCFKKLLRVENREWVKLKLAMYPFGFKVTKWKPISSFDTHPNFFHDQSPSSPELLSSLRHRRSSKLYSLLKQTETQIIIFIKLNMDLLNLIKSSSS